ncbi:PD-(D/E)XK nuclease family protein [Methanobrevibacter millerae]|uniref:RecB family exonuclease n=1 Tax=Methanobrevibacter millerae TaxID=230361 RepID=A0A1G5UVX2_9EURY|nr:PD-(D/E)XK nuclease family protein [Methanobrevibacter millerae]SDA37783.1 RecB family exonuclease [Methanobrevibacter millerae]
MSKSKINTYIKCPREFKYRYIDEIEVPPNEYMALGSDVHLIAEKYAEIYGDNPQENPRYFLDLISEQLNIGVDDIDVHLESLSDFFKLALIEKDFKIFSQEEYLTNETHNFTGITDLILENSSGELIVIDYKTGSSSSFSKCRLELGYYKMLVESAYDRDVIGAGIFFTKDNKLRVLYFEDEENKRKFMHSKELEEGIDTLYKVREKVNAGKFPKNRQYICRFCTYEEICYKDFD